MPPKVKNVAVIGLLLAGAMATTACSGGATRGGLSGGTGGAIVGSATGLGTTEGAVIGGAAGAVMGDDRRD